MTTAADSLNTPPALATENRTGDAPFSVGPLLARANLLRMRGQWDEAIAACTEALRQTPDSPTAHALLGDIYEAQGKLDDALQWFSMAVELDPNNPADRAKFDRLATIQRERVLAEQAAQSPPPKAAKEKTLDWIDRQFPPGRSESVARLIWAMSGVMTFLIIGCAGFLYFFSQNHGTMAKNGVAVSPLEVKSPVVIAPPAAIPVVSTAVPPLPSPENPNALRDKIAAQTREMTIIAVQMDARVGQIALVVALPPRRENVESEEQLRDRIVRSAAAVAHLAAKSDARAATARISVSLNPDGSSPVFAGMIPLEAIRKSDISLGPIGEILAHFTQLQWMLPSGSSDSATSPTPSPQVETIPAAMPAPSSTPLPVVPRS